VAVDSSMASGRGGTEGGGGTVPRTAVERHYNGESKIPLYQTH